MGYSDFSKATWEFVEFFQTKATGNIKPLPFDKIYSDFSSLARDIYLSSNQNDQPTFNRR